MKSSRSQIARETLPLGRNSWTMVSATDHEFSDIRRKKQTSWTIKTRDARRITAAEIKYMRITAGYTRTDYKTNTQIKKELKITQILEKLLECKRNWIQHVNRMPHNRLPRLLKHYSPPGRRNYGRPLKRLLDT